jgi:hypothetical protein
MEHITSCVTFAAKRKHAGELLIKTVLDALKLPEPKAQQELTDALRNWLDGKASGDWKTKWTWRGYISKTLWKVLEEQAWKDEQNPLSIAKKIQIIVTETIAECWFRRCKALHTKEVDEQQMKKRCEGIAQKVQEIKSTQKKNEQLPQIPKDTVRTPLISKPQFTQPRHQNTEGTDITNQDATRQPRKRRERSPRRTMSNIYAAEAAASAEVATATSAAADDAEELSLLTPLWILPPAKPPDKQGTQHKRTGESLSERPAQLARKGSLPTQRAGGAESDEEKAAAKRKRPEATQDPPPGPKKSGTKPT